MCWRGAGVSIFQVVKAVERTSFFKVGSRVTYGQGLGDHSYTVCSVCYFRVSLFRLARFRSAIRWRTVTVALNLKRKNEPVGGRRLAAFPALKLRVLCAV